VVTTEGFESSAAGWRWRLIPAVTTAHAGVAFGRSHRPKV
jgi:hypothetical protein